MKVEVENKPESVSTLRIELPPDEVTKEWDAIANSFARFAKIPGYRPGKAPRRVIEAKFRKEIQDELTRKLVSKSYRDAIEQKQLRVVSLTNLEDVEFGDDKSIQFKIPNDPKLVAGKYTIAVRTSNHDSESNRLPFTIKP